MTLNSGPSKIKLLKRLKKIYAQPNLKNKLRHQTCTSPLRSQLVCHRYKKEMASQRYIQARDISKQKACFNFQYLFNTPLKDQLKIRVQSLLNIFSHKILLTSPTFRAIRLRLPVLLGLLVTKEGVSLSCYLQML
jgi:hypothetical protein